MGFLENYRAKRREGREQRLKAEQERALEVAKGNHAYILRQREFHNFLRGLQITPEPMDKYAERTGQALEAITTDHVDQGITLTAKWYKGVAMLESNSFSPDQWDVWKERGLVAIVNAQKTITVPEHRDVALHTTVQYYGLPVRKMER